MIRNLHKNYGKRQKRTRFWKDNIRIINKWRWPWEEDWWVSKGQLEKNLEGLTVNIKPQPRKQQVSLLLKGDYEIGIDGWSPDFADPITFLELFTTNNPYNLDHYSNKEFDEAIEKVKTTLAGDEKARFDALLASEKILFKDSVIAPLYQKGESYLEKSYVKGIVQVDFAGQLNFKWAKIEK